MIYQNGILANRLFYRGAEYAKAYINGEQVFDGIPEIFIRNAHAVGATVDEDLIRSEYAALPKIAREFANITLICGAYKAGTIYGFSNHTGDLVPFTYTRNSIGTYFDKNGILQTALANVPRIDFDPLTLQCRGYLMEKASTNLATHSNNPAIIGGGWAIVSATVSSIGDGWELAQQDITGRATRSANVVPGTTYVWSFYAKKGTADGVRFAVRDNTNNLEITGNVDYDEFINSNTYTRIKITFTAPDNCTSVLCYPLINSLVAGTVFFKNCQLETGTDPTTYIPTTASQVTRVVESPLQGAIGLLKNNDFSVYSVATMNNLSYGSVINVSSTPVNSNFNSFGIVTTNLRLESSVGGRTNRINAQLSSPPKTAKMITSIGGGNLKVCLDGVNVQTILDYIPITYTAQTFSIFDWISTRIAHLRTLVLFNRQLTDLEHIQITT